MDSTDFRGIVMQQAKKLNLDIIPWDGDEGVDRIGVKSKQSRGELWFHFYPNGQPYPFTTTPCLLPLVYCCTASDVPAIDYITSVLLHYVALGDNLLDISYSSYPILLPPPIPISPSPLPHYNAHVGPYYCEHCGAEVSISRLAHFLYTSAGYRIVRPLLLEEEGDLP